MSMHFKNKKSFTLAEMMVAMVIISVILVALMPVMTKRRLVSTDVSNGAVLHGKQFYTSTSLGQTFIVPRGIKRVWVSMCGGGGGGFSNSPIFGENGGGAEAVMYQEIQVNEGESIPIIVGTGGFANGGSGGASSFGHYLTCNGGGAATSSEPGAAGGDGGADGDHFSGSSLFGSGGVGNGVGFGYGSGGQSGTAGRSGMVLVEY